MELTRPDLSPGVNFINILQSAFLPVTYWRKVQSVTQNVGCNFYLCVLVKLGDVLLVKLIASNCVCIFLVKVNG